LLHLSLQIRFILFQDLIDIHNYLITSLQIKESLINIQAIFFLPKKERRINKDSLLSKAMASIAPRKIQKFQQKILSFYKKNKRNLPWRKTTNPYHILISEIMLQQTQVDRVIPYYEKFIKAFPTVEVLAKADKTLLLENWSGLGYNSRVLRLQKCAQILAERNQEIPKNEEFLLQLPGIGPYTANAILAFAFNKPVPVIDTNIRRVLIHELNIPENITLQELQIIAQQCIPKNKSREWHNALMDYGAMNATVKKTGIESLSKQSKFLGSTRWVRGQIIKHLLKNKILEIVYLKQKLKEKYSSQKINEIIEKMEKENIIRKNSNMLEFS